ncbi:Outer membrane usher protein OS=Eoetvoesiella caeni OX=645616 GN=DFR37_106145 PE=4 SV=1 [Eoetvoesiella caeni]
MLRLAKRLKQCVIVSLVGSGLYIGQVAAQLRPAEIPNTQKTSEPPHENSNSVFLSATLNGNPDADLTPFTERDGQLYLSKAGAAQLGFKDDFLKNIAPDTPLSAYPGVKADYNRSMQSVSITAPFSILNVSTAIVGRQAAVRTVAKASPGVMLNYDLYSSYTNKNDIALSSFAELRAFNNFGVLSTSYLLQGQSPHDKPEWTRTTVRLDSTLEHSLQESQITFRVGDTLTNGVSWTRQTRIGGFQVGRNFALQPYQTTAPLPAYFGTAALPSAVELYINGMQQYSGQVQAGPFQLNAMPSINGAGQAQVVLTDALGRRTVVSFPFYNSARLLRSGLTDWSFETGYVRNAYGYHSFDYSRNPMASGTIRHGFNDFLTAESHIEGSKGIVSGGVGAVATVGLLGTVSASWAQSNAQGLKGSQYTLGYQLQRGIFSLGANTQRSAGNYRDVASMYGGVPTIRNDSAYAGVDTGKFGSLSVNYVRLQQADQPRYRYGGVSWSRAFDHGVMLSLSANQNLDDRGDRSVYLSLTFNWDKGISAYGSAVRAKNATTYSAGVSRSSPTEDGWNWNLQGQKTDQQAISASGQASRRTRYADFNAGINSAGASQNAYVGASGSVVAMGGSVFASRRIYDGFAVVSTDGIPDVPIKNQNRPAGNTDSQGLLLVPGLQSYEKNKISIDPTNLPVDMRIEHVNLEVVPRRGSGLNVTFAMERVHAASLILQHPDGRNVAMGAQAYLNGATQSAGWVGYDGRLYLEGLNADNQLIVRSEDTNCSVRFSYSAKADSLPEIGPLPCMP